ncbi:hypothetical protein DMB90_11845 [Raoultella planticola]|uniref:Uncharacterized protein n=1 Tax=Raoultella planticola TaxID=575 RepID=A0A5P6A9V1_RAOPL|nr:hypothetical protein DMB90_11845 [Raoultella planticola]
MIFTAALMMLLVEYWVDNQIPAHIISLFLWRLYSKWQNRTYRFSGKYFSLEVTDGEMFRLFNITKLAEKLVSINIP